MPKIGGGMWPAVLSAYHNDLTPNLDAMDQLVELFIQQGLGGLYVLGSTGQGPALPVKDRKQIAERVVKTAAGRIPVLLHIGCVSFHDTMELAKHASSLAVDGISTVPPIYFPVDTNMTFDYYQEVAEAGNKPFYPYHAGFAMAGVPGAAEYARRLRALPHFAGIKFTDGNMYYLARLIHFLGKDVVVFSGADELFCQAVVSGSTGAIGSYYNLFGAEVKKVNDAFRAGDVDRAKIFMNVFDTIIECTAQTRRDAFAGFFSAGMRIRYGIELGPGHTAMTRGKPVFTDDQVRELIDQVVEAAG